MTPLPRSIRLITPVTNFSLRPKKSSKICSLSASRTFCKITCFAACAPIRPNSIDSNGTSIVSFSTLPSARASNNEICASSFSMRSSVTNVQRLKDLYSPVSRSISTRTSMSSLFFFFVAEAKADSSASKTTSLLTFFSWAKASTNNKISRLISISANHFLTFKFWAQSSFVNI